MGTCVDVNESWYWEVEAEINAFIKKLDEKIEAEDQQLRAQKKNNDLESKLAQELKLNTELTQQLTEVSKRGSELDRVCAALESCLTIADSDQNRLDNAKETYEIAKELTGIRFDYSAPSDIAKGFVKSEPRRLLQAFEQRAEPDALWERIRSAAHTSWPRIDKENKPNNK